MRAALGLALLATPNALAAQTSAPALGPNPSPAAVAAESLLDARTRVLASQLRCPVCQGLSLQDSPSELSQQMRDIVRQQLADGKTPEQVKAYFVGRYGEWILMEPERHGFNWMVYVLPLAALGLGAWVLVGALRRWTATATPSATAQPPSGGSPTIS